MPSQDPQPPTFAPALGEGGFEPYFLAARRHPWIVAVVALAALLGAGAWLAVRSPRYEASAKVLLTTVPFDDATYSGLPVLRDTSADPTRASETAAAMIDTPTAAAAAAQALGRGWSEGRVRAAVTVTPIGGTNVLAVQARADQPGLAARIATAFARAALDQRRRTLRREATDLIAQLKSGPPRSVPAAPLDHLVAVSQGFDPSFSLLDRAPAGATTGPAVWRILSSALIAGVVLGVGAALLTEASLRRRRMAGELVEIPGGASEAGPGRPQELPSRKDAPSR